MTQLAAWVFADDQGARRTELVLGRLAAQESLMLSDGRVIGWQAGDARPVTRRIYSVPLTDARDDIVWGLLLGQVIYAAEAAIFEPLQSIGVDPGLIEWLRRALAPGRSALVVLADGQSLTRVGEALAPHKADLWDSSPA